MYIQLSVLQDFIKKDLKPKLIKDLRNVKIVKEADLVSCAYYHIRKRLSKDPKWYIGINRYIKSTGYYADMVLFRRFIPRIVMEFKWSRKSISKKDRDSLFSSLKVLNVNRVYFITTVKNKDEYKRLKKEKHDLEKYNLVEIIIPYDLPEDKYAEIKTIRSQYRTKMNVGRSKRKLN